MPKINDTSHASCPIGPPAWQYHCRQCGHEFQMPVPSGPSEEKEHTCPRCHSRDIDRINVAESQACPPGG